MVAESGVREPSTSSGEWPPTQTVAPKLRKSCLDLRTWEVLMPHDGSGVRSGSALAGTCDSSGTFFGSEGSGLLAGRLCWLSAGEQQPFGEQQPCCFTTCTVTVALRSRAGIPNSRL